jgi:uncharacterized protein (TIGR02145 family)
MKKLVYIVTILGLSFSCIKEATNDNSNNTSSVACIDNPKINFTSIGTPVGKFSDCIKDIDGNTYKTVTIGSQTWMAENLKTSKYNDGTTIPNIIDNTKWLKDTSGAWCYYKNDTSYNSKYGKLYNGYVIINMKNKNVCPTGWHIPSYSEWTILTDYLGGEKIAGGKMKEIGTSNWNSPNTSATNVSLFSALPISSRLSEGFDNNKFGTGVSWWSQSKWKSPSNDGFTVTGNSLWYFYVESYHSELGKLGSALSVGSSIRCIKD